jgi:hypothetical protein
MMGQSDARKSALVDFLRDQILERSNSPEDCSDLSRPIAGGRSPDLGSEIGPLKSEAAPSGEKNGRKAAASLGRFSHGPCLIRAIGQMGDRLGHRNE